MRRLDDIALLVDCRSMAMTLVQFASAVLVSTVAAAVAMHLWLAHRNAPAPQVVRVRKSRR